MEKRKNPAVRFKGFEDDWEQRKLGEYVSITSGEAPSKFEVGTELYVKVDDLNYNDKYVVDTQNKVAEHSTIKRVTKGSVIFPKRGAAIMTNKVRILGIDSYMDTNMMSLSSEKLDSEFLYNIISKEGLYKIADTSTIPQINNKHIEPYEVIIPSLDEQKRIGVYFRSLDHLITLHQRKLEKLQLVKKSMLEKMFPKNDLKIPEIRFEGFTDDWEQRKLGEFGTVQTCKRIFKDQTSEQGDIPFFKNGTIGMEPDSYISREVYEEFRRLYPYPEVGDVLISVVGSIGRTAEYTGKDEYFQDSNIVWLKTDGSINKKFLKISYQVINWLIEGSTVKHLYNDNILRSEIVTPPLQKEQAKIAAYFDNLDTLITLHQRKLAKMKSIKKSLLEKLFVQ